MIRKTCDARTVDTYHFIAGRDIGSRERRDAPIYLFPRANASSVTFYMRFMSRVSCERVFIVIDKYRTGIL
jgi:hypothetical protein